MSVYACLFTISVKKTKQKLCCFNKKNSKIDLIEYF